MELEITPLVVMFPLTLIVPVHGELLAVVLLLTCIWLAAPRVTLPLMLYTAVPVCGPALSKTINLLPLLLPVNDTLPPIFHVQLAEVAVPFTADILAAIPGPTITLPATVCVYVPDVAEIPRNVCWVIFKLPLIVKLPLGLPLEL